MHDITGISGEFRITKNGKTKVIKNTIMDSILTELAEVLRGENPDIEIKYLAVGTDDTPVTTSDTQLGAEIFRAPVTSETTVSIGKIEHQFTILDTEAVGSLKELGIFGGSTATGTANSGTLISRVLWDEEKSNSEEINVVYTNTITRK